MTTQVPNALLSGGPSHLRDSERIRFVPDLNAVCKLQNGNRYEHYEPTSEMTVVGGFSLHVFAWTRCTYVAE